MATPLTLKKPTVFSQYRASGGDPVFVSQVTGVLETAYDQRGRESFTAGLFRAADLGL
jgi:hypothetical protein